MQFHFPLKLPLLLCFLTQNHFLQWKWKITIPNDLHHWKASTETIFLSLVLICQYILIWWLEFFQRSGHHMLPISCKASYGKMSHFFSCIFGIENSFLSGLGPKLDFSAWGSYAVELAHCGGGGPPWKCSNYYAGLVRIFCTFLRRGGAPPPLENVQNSPVL